MNKYGIVLTFFIAFVMGVISTYLWMTKQQMDRVLGANAKPIPTVQRTNADAGFTNSQIETTDGVASQNVVDQKGLGEPTVTGNLLTSQNVSVQDYTQQQAQAIIDDMPDVVLEQYVDKFMTKDASDLIADKRQFAKRAIEELYSQNDNQPLVGDIRLSTTQIMPSQSMDTSSVDKDATLYAHLDTFGQMPTGAQVFIKWVNTTTGQVLLFEKKDVVADRQQNWVSMTPYDGWQIGNYEIRYYQFTSELVPIAQLNYAIYTVNDTDINAKDDSLVRGVVQAKTNE